MPLKACVTVWIVPTWPNWTQPPSNFLYVLVYLQFLILRSCTRFNQCSFSSICAFRYCKGIEVMRSMVLDFGAIYSLSWGRSRRNWTARNEWSLISRSILIMRKCCPMVCIVLDRDSDLFAGLFHLSLALWPDPSLTQKEKELSLDELIAFVKKQYSFWVQYRNCVQLPAEYGIDPADFLEQVRVCFPDLFSVCSKWSLGRIFRTRTRTDSNCTERTCQVSIIFWCFFEGSREWWLSTCAKCSEERVRERGAGFWYCASVLCLVKY